MTQRNMTSGDDIRARKDAHLEITARGEGAFRSATTLFEEVQLVHQALPELALDAIDLGTEWMGRPLKAPLLIGAMTGGTETARETNLGLAAVAEELGVGFCLGSQRVMAEHPEAAASFQVREVAPTIPILGNIGLVQAMEWGPAGVAALAEAVGADGMAIHLNPAQELAQRHGDRDFRGGAAFLAELVQALDVPIMVKETGAGLSRQVGEALVAAGVGWAEIAGAGGTSWVRVEVERGAAPAWIGPLLSEWGVPTAASLLQLEGLPLQRVASGGVRDAMDVAKALALGAQACALAQPVLVAWREGGAEGARAFLSELIDGLRAICLLTGAPSAAALASAPRIIGPRLAAWTPEARR